MKNYLQRLGLSFLGVCLLVSSQAGPARADTPFEKEGPASVKIGSGLATLNLPKGLGFVGEAKTKAFIEKGGGSSAGALGYVGPLSKEDFGIIISHEDSGYVEDTDGEKLNADELLKNIKDGTEAQNEERKKRDLPGLHVDGWDEPPHYDKAKHVVIWGIKGRQDGESEPFVNYNTRLLGRKGVLEVNLICDQKKLEQYKPEVGKVLDAMVYDAGQRYEDHQQGDKVSAGGIAALVIGGIALKKLGVLAFLGGFFKPLLLLFGKMWALMGKAIVFVFAGIASLFQKLKNQIFGKKSQPSAPPGGPDQAV